MNDIMLDLETLDVRPTGAIVSIGAVRFDINTPGHTGFRFKANVSIDSNIKAGRTMSADTLEWWLRQTKEAQDATFPQEKANVTSLEKALHALNEFLAIEDRVWGNGAAFDNAMIVDAYRSVGLKPRWSYKNDMCYRTMCRLFPEVKFAPFVGVKHDSLTDAINQAHHLQAIYAFMKGDEHGAEA